MGLLMSAGHTPILYGDNDSEIELPFNWEICSHCHGHGKSSAYLGAYTRDDMDEAGPEFLEDYMAGSYDRHCDSCDGTGKVKVANFARMPKAQREAYREQCRIDAELDAEEASERRMLGGSF
jgi:hypothetical protein